MVWNEEGLICEVFGEMNQDGIRHWIISWKRNGWKTASKTPVKNIDLWQELDALAQNRPITWEWVVLPITGKKATNVLT